MALPDGEIYRFTATVLAQHLDTLGKLARHRIEELERQQTENACVGGNDSVAERWAEMYNCDCEYEFHCIQMNRRNTDSLADLHRAVCLANEPQAQGPQAEEPQSDGPNRYQTNAKTIAKP